jgi:hypothetical protein
MYGPTKIQGFGRGSTAFRIGGPRHLENGSKFNKIWMKSKRSTSRFQISKHFIKFPRVMEKIEGKVGDDFDGVGPGVRPGENVAEQMDQALEKSSHHSRRHREQGLWKKKRDPELGNEEDWKGEMAIEKGNHERRRGENKKHVKKTNKAQDGYRRNCTISLYSNI